MIGKMTKADFDRLDEDDRWMTVAGHDVTPSKPAPTLQEQIDDRDAIIAAQDQKLQEAAQVVTHAAQVVERYLEARSQS